MHLTFLKFTRNAEELVQLDLSGLSPSPPPETVTASTLRSERSPDSAYASTTTLLHTQSQTWPSPAFLKRKSFSAAAIFSPQYDPFTEDGNSDDDRRRKKTKLGHASGQWRFSERSPSPEKQTENQFGEDLDTPGQMHYSADRDQPISAQLTLKTPCENVLVNKTSSKSSAVQLEVITKFCTPQSTINDEDSEGAYLPEQPRLRPQTSPELLVISPFQDRKTRFAFLQDQVDPEEQTAEQGHNGAFYRESPDFGGTGQIHELQEYVQGPEVEYPKSSTGLKNPTRFHDESAGFENLTQEHSQSYHNAPIQYEDGLDHQEDYETTVSVDPKHSPKLMNSIAEEVPNRGQKNAISLNLRLPKNGEQDDLWDGTRSGRNEVIGLDIRNTDCDLHRQELHDMAATSDNENEKISEIEEEPSFIQYGKYISHSELVAEPQPSFIADESDYDASDLDDERQDLQNDSEGAMDSMRQREDASSVEQFPTSLHSGSTLPFNNTTREQDQIRREVISIDSDDSEETEESEDADGSRSEELNSRLAFDRPINAADQVEKVSSPDETYEHQISVSPSAGPVAHSANILDQLDAEDDIGQSIISDIQPHKNMHIFPFTPEASGLSSIILEQGDSNGDQALPPIGTGVMFEQEFSLNQADRNLSYDSPIIETDSSLITPLATQLQQVAEYASRLEDEADALDDNHDLLTPRYTQSISEDRLDTVVLNRSRSTIGLLRDSRSSSKSRVENSNNLHESQGIDVCFDGNKHDEFVSSDERQPIQNEESDHESESQEALPNSKSFEVKSPKTIPAELDYRHGPESLHPIPLSTGFRTPLSYFVPLSSLPEYFNSTIDVMVITISASQFGRTTKGPRDYYETVYITDPSSAISDRLPHITTAQIFRPFKIALPIVSTGDVVLLRNFKVQTQKHKPMLLSTESSAWAVFRKGFDVQIRGPQLEFGPEERGFAKGLGDWWVSLDDQGRAELLNSVSKPETGGKSKGKEKEKASRKSTVVHELRDGTRYMDGRVGGMDGVHELRDGTVYTDDAV